MKKQHYIYIKIYEIILNDIKNKKYKTSQKLPSENILANTYKVNRHTIRQALQLLKDNNYIYTIKGKGTFISNINIPYSISNKSSFSSEIIDLGYEPNTKLISAKIIVCPKEVQKELNLNEDMKVIEFILLRYVNDVAVSLSYSYFDAFLYSKLLLNIDENNFSLYKTLEKAYPNLETKKQNCIFHSLIANKQISELLLLSNNVALLAVNTISKDKNENIVEYGTSYFRSDICKIKVNLN
jgi:DNA-binding GntR family transcriptional regulator